MEVSWIDFSYSQNTEITLHTIFTLPGMSVDKLIIRAFTCFASSTSLISTSNPSTPSEIHNAMLYNHATFQCLLLAASSLTHPEIHQYLSSREIPPDKVHDPWITKLNRPNLHAALHFPEMTLKYASIMNCNILSGESKHQLVLSLLIYDYTNY